MMSPQRTIQITVALDPKHRGRYEDRIEFHLEDVSLQQHFAIVRPIIAVVDNKADYEAIKPNAPYVKKHMKPRIGEESVVPGVKPEAFALIQWVMTLPKADIPKSLARVLASGDPDSIAEMFRQTFLPPVFNQETYSKQFQVLLHAEEYRVEYAALLFGLTRC
jgi:helicase MOV-10